MTNHQGTLWETEIVQAARLFQRPAGRYPKRGQADEPDVWIGQAEDVEAIPIVAWKRLVGAKADGRRKPDGERAVIVISFDDWNRYVLPYVPYSFDVQAKWTGALNVTRTLAGLRTWLKERRK